MCGRYTLFGNWKSALPPDIILDDLIEFQDIIDNYNVTPLQTMPILKAVNQDIHATAMRWGFVPAWSKETTPQGMINARSETVSEKPSFRHAFKQRRCLIPMNGFYEWASSPPARNSPFIALLHMKNYYLQQVFGNIGHRLMNKYHSILLL